ncbi:MAG: efflux RND transporter periplasmic adaptor subunit [Paludisphaera borealis]|uniref:efflux RND transporter periplasmic adaptor subunit n=1 Tax=Paludisphaera borealis TaxID=1387353 RepID=UPI0028474FF1|nr:efflux RND transporter periplasmic adaptor subunit [Paludisphaera borealis]MDR3620228.1 efflux RND transporter periplasmic adaptor subunit [Paludisphaera borealis]
MSKRWRLLVSLLLTGLMGCGAKSEPEHAEAEHDPSEATVTVQTLPAKKGKLAELIEGLGRTEAIPDHLATLTPAVEGHVETLLVKQGQSVKKGQPIVELDKSVALADLAEKEATRDGLKASLILLKSLPRPEERKANELAIAQAKVAVVRAKATADRLRPLLARHEAADATVFDAEQAVEQALLQQQSAEALLRSTMIGPRPEAVAEAEAKIKTAEGLVAFSKAHLAFHVIRAPIDGVLDSLTCHPGQTLSVGSPIGEIVDSRQAYAVVWLPPRSAQAVHEGLAAQVAPADATPSHAEVEEEGEKGEAHEPAEETALPGQVESISRMADPQTGNLAVRVLVENPKGRIALGQTVRATIVIEEREDVLQVPAVAVFDLGEGPVIGVVRDGKSVMLHPKIGTKQGAWVEVSDVDLKEGELVITEGGYNLPDGTTIELAEPPAVASAEAGK